MRWEDEPWVKLYTRETGSWMCLTWQARGIFDELMKKVDRAGIVELGRKGLHAVAGLLRAPFSEIEPYLVELLDDGCLVLEGDKLIMPNFVEAQDAKTSDREKKRRSRRGARDMALSKSPDFEKGVSPDVTVGHRMSPDVTASHRKSPIEEKRLEENRIETPLPPLPVLQSPSGAMVDAMGGWHSGDGAPVGPPPDNPETLQFRARLQNALGYRLKAADRETQAEFERQLKRVGLEEALRKCEATASGAPDENQPKSISYFLPVLRRMARAPPKLRKVVGRNSSGEAIFEGDANA